MNTYELEILNKLQKAVSGGKSANAIIKRVNKFFDKNDIDGIARRLEDDNGKMTKDIEVISEDDLLPYAWAMKFGGYTEVDESNGFHSEAEMGCVLNIFDWR
jgi:hypothetical protein|tara:strand:+ start:436 stop:741 length:306 start_codon:yes stop_codon:yes gene_type:complete